MENREILFRGKTLSGEWIKGYLFMTNISTVKSIKLVPCIQIIGEYNEYRSYQVIPESIGQYTNIYTVIQSDGFDKNGDFKTKIKIFHNDIVEFIGGTTSALHCGNYGEYHKIGTILVVQKLKSGWTLCPPHMIDCDIPNRVGKVDNYTFWNHARSLKVIGNTTDNPELLK